MSLTSVPTGILFLPQVGKLSKTCLPRFGGAYGTICEKSKVACITARTFLVGYTTGTPVEVSALLAPGSNGA